MELGGPATHLLDQPVAEDAEEEHLGEGVEEVAEDRGGVRGHAVDLGEKGVTVERSVWWEVRTLEKWVNKFEGAEAAFEDVCEEVFRRCAVP